MIMNNLCSPEKGLIQTLLKFFIFFSMEKPPSLTPCKKRKSETEYNLCVICQEASSEKIVKKTQC